MSFYSGMNESLKKAPQSQSMGSTEDYESDQLAEQKRGEELLDSLVDDKAANIEENKRLSDAKATLSALVNSSSTAPASSSLSNTISTATASSTSSVTSSLIGQSATTPTIGQTAPASTDNKKSPVREAAKVSASSGIGFNFAKPATSPVSSPTVSVTQTTSASAPTGVLAALAGMTSSASVQPPPPGIKGEVTKMAVPPHESRVLATASEGDSGSSYETDTESESESEEEGIRPTGYKSDHSMGKSSWDALKEASEKQLKESKGAKLDKSADMETSACSSVAGSAPSTTSSSGTSSVGGFTFGAKNPASSPLTAPSNPGPNSTGTGTSTAATFTFSAASPPKSTVTSCFSLSSSALASTAASNPSVVSGFATTQPQSSLTTSTSSSTSAPTGFTVPSAFAAPSAGGFTFGQALSAASGTEPPKTTSGSTVSPAAPTFNFGAAASSISGSSNPASTSSNFTFGQVSKPIIAPASAGFNLGGSSNTPTTSAAFTSTNSAVFGFGASNPPTNTTATGNTSSAFTFSGTTTSTASGSTPSSNYFNFGGTSAPSFGAPATNKIGGFSFNPGATTTTSSSMAPAARFGQAIMSDQGATAFPVQTMVECGFCGGTFNVDWFCKTCGGSICDTCYQTHQRASLLRNHIVVPRTVEVLRLHGPAKIAEICRIHPTKEISTYCNDCKIPCCVLCQTEKHQCHAFSPIENKYLSAEESLDQYARELQTDVKPSLDALKDSLKHRLKKHDEQIEKEKDEINTLRYTLKQKVDESCDLLLKELDQAKQDFRNFEKEIDSSKQRLDQLIKDLEIMIGEGKLDIIDYSPPTRKSLIPASPLPVLKVAKFVPGSDLIGLIQNKIGRIEFHDQISDNEETNASSNTALDIDISEQKSLIQVKGIDKADIKVTKVKSFKSKIGVRSLISAGNNSAWVMNNGGNTMYLYYSNGHVVRSLEVKNSQGINDMVITRSGDMIVTCQDNTVKRVSVGGEVSILINTGDYEPVGVCLTDKEEIVVCMFMLRRGHVLVYSPDGRSKLREIRGVDSQGKPQITSPYRVVCNDEDLCVVCGSNVMCVDEGDNVKWVYDGKQANLRMSFNPHGICVDKYHNLLVTDRENNCVHYVDREGGLIQVIMTQEQTGLGWPCGICVDDETGQVWVGYNLFNVVVIAKYLK